MHRKPFSPSTTVFLFICTMTVSCTTKSMKRFQEDSTEIRDSKRQKSTENSSNNKELSPFAELPADMQEKIIAILPNKNSIRAVSRDLKERTSKRNISIYRQNPLHLTPRMQEFGASYAVDKNDLESIKNLADQQYLSHLTDKQKSFMITLATQNHNNREMLAQLQSLFPNQKSIPVINRIAVATYHDDLNELEKLIKFAPVGDARRMKFLQAVDVLPAFIAAQKGYLDILEFFKKNKPELLEEITEDGFSLLHAAVRPTSNSDVLEYLLDNTELDINKESAPLKTTPLHMAAKYNNPGAIRILIERGAAINPIAVTKFDNNPVSVTPAGIAIFHNKAKALAILLPYYESQNIPLLPFRDKDKALQFAIANNYPDIVELLKPKDL